MKKLTFLLSFALAGITITNPAQAQLNYLGVTGNMVAGDFDNDNLLDDIAAFNTASDIPELVIWSAGTNNFTEMVSNVRLLPHLADTKALNGKIVSGDFDNDGFHDDLAAIYEIGLNQTSITIWKNDDGIFTPEQWWFGGDFDANQTALTLVSGDFDSDGFHDDLAAFYDYDQKSTKIFVWNSNGKKFNWPNAWWIGNDFNSTRVKGTMVAGDFNQDGFTNDIAALYNYHDGYCKIFVWSANGKKFNWPQTWFKQAGFNATNAQGNVVAGDFDHNGYIDNIAAIYKHDDTKSEILVWKRTKSGFDAPSQWWVGSDEASKTEGRFVAIDGNQSGKINQITGLYANGSNTELLAWESEKESFGSPKTGWVGTVLGADCDKNGGCMNENNNTCFALYPNPCNGNTNLTMPTEVNENVTVMVFNVMGSCVKTFELEQGATTNIDLTSFGSGHYVVNMVGKATNLKLTLIVE